MIGPVRAVTSRVLLVVLLLAVVGGCALTAQDAPDPVAGPPATPSTTTARPPPPGGASVTVYLLRDERLVAVQRRGQPTVQGALDLLAAGPSPAEAATGIDSVIAPGDLTLTGVSRIDGTAVVTVGDGFAALTGRRQLLAAGQVVWTVTSAPGVVHVRLVLDGTPVATPTDDGLTWEPVTRADYRILAPRS